MSKSKELIKELKTELSTELNKVLEITPEISLVRAKKAIYTADLSAVIDRLVHVKKWSIEDAKEACEQYRNYIYLLKKYKDLVLPPSLDIDEVWHAHILHTNLYFRFCEQVFGKYLHHTPGDPNPNNTTAAAEFNEQFENNTQELYRKEFGDYIYNIRIMPLRVLLSTCANKLHKFILKHMPVKS